MGNTPSSSSKPPTTPTQSHHDSPRSGKRDATATKYPIPAHNQRVAAPPEPSLAQAQGTTSSSSSNNNNNRPRPPQPRPIIASLNNSSASSTPASSVASPRNTEERRPPESGHQPPNYQPAKPVAVPNTRGSSPSPRSPASDMIDSGTMPLNGTQDLYTSRPPRLPLPIEEEVHTPGSPIINPTDISEPLEEIDLEGEGLGRRSLTSSTVDDDDAEELRVDKSRPTVPTRLEWLRGGDKVYVTGTIFHWNRKTRLIPVENHPGVFAATINILPGTHHLRFLVDGQMQTSPDLPTTVDFGNNLVNYIEVSPDDVPTPQQEAAGAPSTGEGIEAVPAKPSPQPKPTRGKAVEPLDLFSSKIPRYLLDFDQPEDSPPYQSAVTAIEKLPTPPSLPGFLGKPILNAATLIKDDNSVLNMPNHTVLNHLATSSIKNNILAVSATTRYKNKYVTTIVYKPTGQDGS